MARLIGEIIERRQAEQALQKSERLLRETQRIAQLGGWELELEAGRIACTEEVYRIHQVPADREPSLEHALSYYEPADRALLEQAMSHGVETGELWDLELPFTSTEGEHLWVRAEGQVEQRNGGAVKLSGIFQDITEQKQAEETRSLLASIVEASGEAIISTDLNGTILSWNPGAERTFGYSAVETLGRRITDLAPPQVAVEAQQLLDRVAAGNHVERHEMTWPAKGGHPVDISVTASPIRDGNGNTYRMAVIVNDISELKQAERAMREVNDRLELTVRKRTRDLLSANEELLALARSEREQRQIAELFTRATLALSRTLKLEPLLQTLLDHLSELVPYDSAHVLLWQSPTQLTALVDRGYERRSLPTGPAAILLKPSTNPYLEQALDGHTSILIPDTRTSANWRHPLGAQDTLGWPAVPLTAGDEVIGLCGLDSVRADSFTPRHVQLAEALAGQAAVAIQNAWLFEQVRAGRERLQAMARGLVEVQESERRYVARELHDQAGQALSSLRIGLGLLERDADRSEAVIAGAAELRRIADCVMEDLHRLAMDLRPHSLDHLGLEAALRQHIEDISEKHGLTIQFETIGLDGRLSPEAETALYRIAQEALTNVVRHGLATRCCCGRSTPG